MQIKTSKPEVIWKANTLLGEGTLWVPSQSSIFFVDIKKKKIFIFNLKTSKKKIIKLDKEIGFLSHIKKNIFILGLKSELRVVNLKTKKTLDEIAELRGLSRGTIAGHLIKIRKDHPKEDLSFYEPDKNIMKQVRKVHEQQPKGVPVSLNAIYSGLEGKVSYDDIKLAIAFLEK